MLDTFDLAQSSPGNNQISEIADASAIGGFRGLRAATTNTIVVGSASATRTFNDINTSCEVWYDGNADGTFLPNNGSLDFDTTADGATAFLIQLIPNGGATCQIELFVSDGSATGATMTSLTATTTVAEIPYDTLGIGTALGTTLQNIRIQLLASSSPPGSTCTIAAFSTPVELMNFSVD